MNPEYGEIFDQRGHPYHAAMTRFPQARGDEFSALFARLPLVGGECILDIPAGGGYLARALGARARVTSLEITSGFGPQVPVVDPHALDGHRGFDRAVCLAALHHFAAPLEFLARVRATLRAGGILHLADVAAGSPLCDFLDGFVGLYNVTGHAGRYLPADPAYFLGLGKVVRCEQVECPWRFADEQEMLEFCDALFGLVDCPKSELRAALHELIGVRGGDRSVVLAWRLLYVDIAVCGDDGLRGIDRPAC